MTPTPDIEPIREGLAREIWLQSASFPTKAEHWDTPGEMLDIDKERYFDLADACLTYLIKRQAFHSDAYAVIKKEGLGR